MKSRFTDLIKYMMSLKMSEDDIKTIIECRVCEHYEIERIKEEVEGSDARENEIAHVIDKFNERENDIWAKYIKLEYEGED